MERSCRNRFSLTGTAAHGRINIGAGEKCEEKETSERSYYGLTITPTLHPPAPPGLGLREGSQE